MKTMLKLACLSAMLIGTAAMAQPAPPPEQDIGWHHGNLEAAQSLTRQAYDKLRQAQRDNHGQLGGHADRAEQLLDQASSEMKAAAVYANHGH